MSLKPPTSVRISPAPEGVDACGVVAALDPLHRGAQPSTGRTTERRSSLESTSISPATISTPAPPTSSRLESVASPAARRRRRSPARASASRRRARAATRTPTVPAGDGARAPSTRLEAHEHAGRPLDLGEQPAVDRAARPSGRAPSGRPRRGEHERLVLARAPGPGDGLARRGARARAARARTGAAPTRAARRRPAGAPSSTAAASVRPLALARRPSAAPRAAARARGRRRPRPSSSASAASRCSICARAAPATRWRAVSACAPQLAIDRRARDERRTDGGERDDERERERRTAPAPARAGAAEAGRAMGRGRSPPESHASWRRRAGRPLLDSDWTVDRGSLRRLRRSGP